MSSTTQPVDSTLQSPSVQVTKPGRSLRWLTAETSTAQAAFHGLANGAMLGITIAAMLSAYEQMLLPAPFHLLLFGFLGFALVSLGDGIFSLLWKIAGFTFRKLKAEKPLRFLHAVSPANLGRLVATVVILYAPILFPDSLFSSIHLASGSYPLVWSLAVSGALIDVARMPKRSRSAVAALLSAAVLVNLLVVGWLLYRGTDDYLARAELSAVSPEAEPVIDLPDPGQRGQYAVNTLTYGSGKDRQRDVYGRNANLATPSVNGLPIYAGFGGLGGAVASWYWGFDGSELPLNGRVWYPEGDGPFPLVLIVHGNHSMSDYSDAGYGYLAEHLASRGMIAVSVDENFLNGYTLADGDGMEMPLRGWLLLKHLQQWRNWNETPGNPFSDQVDLDRVALIGHSRGGEAVAHAAILNQRLYRPVTMASEVGEFGFGIRGVVGIAPSDGQYKPNGLPLTLEDTNYLMMVGGHDADTHTAMALPTYNRAKFVDEPGAFAVVAYLYRANHGQFNTEWADKDYNLMDSMLLNRRAYLSGDEQRQAAKVIVTAFLEASLNDQGQYRMLFKAPQTAAAWLPDDLLVTAYKDGSFLAVDTGVREGKIARVDMPGAAVDIDGFSQWGRQQLLLRDKKTRQENIALRLAWEPEARPQYTLNLPSPENRSWTLSDAQALTFGLVSADVEPRPLTVSVELESATGQVVRLPLSQFGAIHPPLPARILKADWVKAVLGFDKIDVQTPYERVLQTYVLPLNAFEATDPAFQADQLTVIRFLFDGPEGGALYLDEIGFLNN